MRTVGGEEARDDERKGYEEGEIMVANCCGGCLEPSLEVATEDHAWASLVVSPYKQMLYCGIND